MLKKIMMILIVLVAVTGLVFADTLDGKSLAEQGLLETRSGTLAYRSGEWYLESEEGSYLLHFGNKVYLEETGIDLAEGETCTVRGFFLEDEGAVMEATMRGDTYRFRADDGMPLWAGRGERSENRVYARNRENGCEDCGPENGERRGGYGEKDGRNSSENRGQRDGSGNRMGKAGTGNRGMGDGSGAMRGDGENRGSGGRYDR